MKENYAKYEQQHALPGYARKAMDRILICRTDQLGGHAWQCGNCKHTKVAYNSCKNRSCPQCGWVGVQKWVIRTNPKIIERDHFHMIFSIPEELNDLWVKDTKLMIQLLFKAVKQTIEEFSDLKTGCLMTLHTWSRTLALHPHIHCLITAGGLNRKGEWQDSGDYLFPILAVSKWFRTRYLLLIRENAAALGGKSTVNPLIHPLFDKKWNVFISKKYKHGFGVMKYLSNYIKGGPIKNTRLLSYDGNLVTFRYKDHRDNKQKVMTLPKEEFMRRFLQHLVPKSLRILRFTGIYAQKKKNSSAQSISEVNSTAFSILKLTTEICPECGSLMTLHSNLNRKDILRFKPPPISFAA